MTNEMDYSQVTRFEVVEWDGRTFVKYDVEIERLELQDNGQTLKVFLRPRHDTDVACAIESGLLADFEEYRERANRQTP